MGGPNKVRGWEKLLKINKRGGRLLSTKEYLFAVCPFHIPQKTEVSIKNVLRMLEAHFWKKFKNIEPR